jgi:hypothetical protein
LVVTRRQRDAILGDLEERFHEDVRSCGVDRAISRYRAEAFSTVFHLVWPKLKRLGLFALLVSALRRLIG